MEINVQTSKIPAVLRKLIQNRLAADPDVFILISALSATVTHTLLYTVFSFGKGLPEKNGK